MEAGVADDVWSCEEIVSVKTTHYPQLHPKKQTTRAPRLLGAQGYPHSLGPVSDEHHLRSAPAPDHHGWYTTPGAGA
jgi:hypothetical protein